MQEFLRQYRRLVRIGSGPWFAARAYASQSPLGRWEAWLAFFPIAGGPIVTSGPATFADTLEAVDRWTMQLSLPDLHRLLEAALTRPDASRHPRRASG
jgi:hypothetical protein